MKPFVLFLLVSFALIAGLHAQVDPLVQAAVSQAFPEQHAGTVALVLVLIAIVGRGIKALQNGKGLVGWWHAILYGTNTPRIVIAGLCLLLLPACQTTAENQRLGSLVSLAVTVAEKRGAITADEAAAIRAAQTIVLPPVVIEAAGK